MFTPEQVEALFLKMTEEQIQALTKKQLQTIPLKVLRGYGFGYIGYRMQIQYFSTKQINPVYTTTG